MAVVRYIHHGTWVAVEEDLKGKHQKYCLCYRCDELNTEGNRNLNCPIANALYRLDVLTGITTPVWECPEFYPKEYK
ncbi:hypothetical protein LCGC14_0236160 [marine sediment metagenome]|uniref:Uncharacterized protein n=1 Tax=marine sediment metagenome TaxID=412755 RepID=A0A0F9U9A6_9ZZZZ